MKRVLVGLIFSLGGLYLAFGQIDLNNLSFALSSVKWPPIILASGAILVSVWIRAMRWRLILRPIKDLNTHSLFGAAMIGYFGNSVLPFRLGEFMRAYALNRDCHSISTSVAFGTLIVERTLDMIGVTILIFSLFFLNDIPSWLVKIGITLSGFVVIALIALLWIARNQAEWLEKIEISELYQEGIRGKFKEIFKSLIIGLSTLRKVSEPGLIIFHSVLLWVLYWFITFLCIYAVGIKLSLVQVGILMVAVTMIIILPAAPGFIGTYHAGAVIVLVEIFDVSQVSAQVYAIINHAVGFLPFVVIGAFYFLRSSITFQHVNSIKSLQTHE